MTPNSLPLEGQHAANRPLRGSCFLTVACVLLYTLAPALYADPHPAWPSTFLVDQTEQSYESDIRYTFVLPKRHPFCLVEIPSRHPDGSYPEHYAVRFGERWLNFRFVHAGESRATLLVDATQALGGDTIEIYPLGHADAPMPDSHRPSSDSASPDFWIVRAPQPISCEFRPSRFTTDPLPPDILTSAQAGLFRRSGPERFLARNFDAANAQIRNARHERRGTAFSDGLADLYTWVYIDQPGTYLFAVRGRGASALSLGPEEKTIATSFVPAPKNRFVQPQDLPAWSLGPELQLEPGAYRLHIENYYLQDPALSIGWLRPGAGEIAEIPPEDLLSGQDTLPFVRAERRDDALVTGFRTFLSSPYAFVGSSNVFVSCTATPRASLWVAPPETEEANRAVYDWAVDGVPAGSSDAAKTFVLPDGPHDIAVTATLHGHTATATNTVYVHGLPDREYRVAAALNGIAPLLRDDDILRPDLWITGDFNPPVTLEATLSVQLLDGSVQTYSNTVNLVQNWARLEGAALPVSSVASLSWSLRHSTIVLAEDTLELQRPPFTAAPASLVASTLRTDATHSIAYVLPRRAAPGAAPLQTMETGGRGRKPATVSAPSADVLLLGDLLLPPAATTNDLADLADAFGPGVRHLRVSELRHDSGESLSGAAFLCGLDAIPAGSTIVLALGSEAMLKRIDTEEYERELLALALLLRDVRGARVVIATPPPFADTPVPVRPYATAALRAAALGGFPTADFYSSFQTRSGNGSDPLVAGLRLTPAGLRRAAETVSRSLSR